VYTVQVLVGLESKRSLSGEIKSFCLLDQAHYFDPTSLFWTKKKIFLIGFCIQDATL